MLSISEQPLTLPLDECLQIALREVTDLVDQLEPTLTARQISLLHQVRLASESLGAARATLVLKLR